jgi:trigger factor
MHVEIEDVSPVEKKLTVEIPWETVQSKLGEAFGQLARDVSLKGFRKGKVPRSVIERMFGKRVRAEVADQLARESFLEAIRQHHIAIVSEPHFHDTEITRGEAFRFHAHVEVRSDFTLDNQSYEGLALTRRPIQVSDEDVAHALEDLRRENTDLQAVESRDLTARTDVLVVAVKGKIGDETIDRPQLVIELDDHSREPLPGLAAALTGLPIDVKDHPVTLAVPAAAATALAGKTAELTVSILDARQKVVPDLDDELAKDTGKAESLDELRQVLRGELTERAKEDVQRGLREAALKELVKKNPIPVAPGLVGRALDSQLERLSSLFGMGPSQDVREQLGADVRERLAGNAEDDVRGEFLIEAVAEREGVKVSAEEIDERIANIAKLQGTHANRLRAELERDDKLANIEFTVRREKTLDLLIARATITDTESAAAAGPPAPDAEKKAPADPG